MSPDSRPAPRAQAVKLGYERGEAEGPREGNGVQGGPGGPA